MRAAVPVTCKSVVSLSRDSDSPSGRSAFNRVVEVTSLYAEVANGVLTIVGLHRSAGRLLMPGISAGTFPAEVSLEDHPK
jgi:hypothetical protein